MSQTLFIKFRGQGFWAFDVFSGVFLKYLIDAVIARPDYPEQRWLSEAVANWRVNAVISDLGFFLDDSWTSKQLHVFTQLTKTACNELAKRAEIPAEEITSWSFVDCKRIFPRGLSAVSTASVIRLGLAIVQLVEGALPDPPAGTWWFFGPDGAERTIPKREWPAE